MELSSFAASDTLLLTGDLFTLLNVLSTSPCSNYKSAVSTGKTISSFLKFEYIPHLQILHIGEHLTTDMKHEDWELEQLNLEEH